MSKSLFTPAESSEIVLAVFNAQTDKDIEKLLTKLERIFIDKLVACGENERLLGLTK